MATIRHSIDIAAPVERVWDLLENVRRLPEYSGSTHEVRDAPDRLTAVGQEYVRGHDGPRRALHADPAARAGAEQRAEREAQAVLEGIRATAEAA